MAEYNGFDACSDCHGVSYACPHCGEVYRYGNNADVDLIDADLASHRCPAPVDFRAEARRILAAYWKRKEKATDNRLSQAQIDGRDVDWHKDSETTNAKLARILR